MKNQFSFIQYSEGMYLPNGVYCGRYNKEPSVIRIEKGKPVYVSFIGFIKEGESRSSAIFDARGIMISNVEILLPAQEFSVYNKMKNMNPLP